MKKFAVGDIHGAYKALLQVLERSGFDKEKDRLVCLGDVADGFPEVPECFDELLSIKNLVYVIGNHDFWLSEYFRLCATPHIWTSQGGKATLDAYVRLLDSGDTKRQVRHQNLLEQSPYYFVDEDSRLYVHGGFDWHRPIEEQPHYDLMWDRHLFQTASYWHFRETGDKVDAYNEVFIGHTALSKRDGKYSPAHFTNVWNLDTGAGWNGVLTLMDVDTKEYWQSDNVLDLYSGYEGRR